MANPKMRSEFCPNMLLFEKEANEKVNLTGLETLLVEGFSGDSSLG